MLVAAVMYLPNMNKEDPIQLTLFASAETVTVTVVPADALVKELGEIVTLPVTPELDNVCNTPACTLAEVASVNVAWRAPSRDALTSSCFTIVILPMSMSPIVNNIISGATSANSTSAAPVRRLLFLNRLAVLDRLLLMQCRKFEFVFMMSDQIERLKLFH